MQPQASARMEHPDICALSVVGVVAMGAIVIGGAKYLTSVGNPAAIDDAKQTIYSAITGLILALSTWVIISTINPDILILQKPDMASWRPAGYVPMAKNNTPVCGWVDLSTGDCTCIDEKITTNVATIITLTSPANGLSVSVSDIAIFAGKLTDSSGVPISGAQVKVYKFYGAGMRDLSGVITTNASGDFNGWDPDPFSCAANIALRAYFAGDTTYSPSVSGINTITVTGGSVCTAADFTSTPRDFSSTANCSAVCADPANFHCAKVGLGLGTTPEQAMSGNQALSVVKNTNVYIAAKTDIMKDNPYKLGKVKVYIDGDALKLDWALGVLTRICVFDLDSSCSDGGLPLGCTIDSTTSTDQPWNPDKKVGFIHKYASSANLGADFYFVNPATGKCDPLSYVQYRGASIQITNP